MRAMLPFFDAEVFPSESDARLRVLYGQPNLGRYSIDCKNALMLSL